MTDTTNICDAIKGLPDKGNIFYLQYYNDYRQFGTSLDLKALVAENESLKEQVDTTKVSISEESVRFLLGQLMTCTGNFGHGEYVSSRKLTAIADALGFRFVWNDKEDEYEAVRTTDGGNDDRR